MELFHISDHLTIEGNGQVSLTDEELAKLNRLIKEAGFEEQLEADHEPKIVVGYVKHASRILTLTIYRLLRQKWTMGQYCKLFAVHQISKLDKSCRCKTRSHDARWNDDLARNFARVASYGMICSARELHLPNAPEKRNLSIA